jgi:hypothetical protein
MAATPFVGNIVVVYQNGKRETIPVTMSDVNTEKWVGPDGSTDIKFDGSAGQAKIIDVMLSAAGVDTRTSQIRVNGKLLPETVLHGVNIGTAVLRQYQQVPLKLPQGAIVQFIQTT